ncbi:hypothetical protein MYP14_13120 [Rhodococcus pyridinivorans]|uniref:hypothetical protein n=1 Tax=Rhodococcus pyridinivorans TaxID=103816 RepID=UPI001FFFD938|nr:hypothetical protein [Rhodococcus pyridinivorans]UPK61803.1 hypothetical protein MYP14_13120 [Rhodococcus pyridinivorans]
MHEASDGHVDREEFAFEDRSGVAGHPHVMYTGVRYAAESGAATIASLRCVGRDHQRRTGLEFRLAACFVRCEQGRDVCPDGVGCASEKHAERAEGRIDELCGRERLGDVLQGATQHAVGDVDPGG